LKECGLKLKNGKSEMTSKSMFFSILFFALTPGVLTFWVLNNYFDVFYYLIFVIFLIALFSSRMGEVLKNLKDHIGYKIMEISLLVVCITIIGVIFSFHNSTRESDDPITQRGDPLKWARPSNIITHPINQIKNKYSPPIKKISFTRDSSEIINLIVIDATVYKQDKDNKIANFKNLYDSLSEGIFNSCGIPPGAFDLRNTIAKYLVCKSYENVYKDLRGVNKNIKTCLFYYIGNDSIYKLKSNLIYKADEIKGILESDYQDCVNSILQKRIGDGNRYTNFKNLFEQISANFFNRREISDKPNVKITLSIISDFLDEGIKVSGSNGSSIYDTEESFKRIVRDSRVKKINFIKVSSFTNLDLPIGSADVLALLQRKIDQTKDTSSITINNPDFRYVKYGLESCLYPVQYDSYDKIIFHFPYDGEGTNSMRKACISFTDRDQEGVTFFYAITGGSDENFNTTLNITNERNKSTLIINANSADCFANSEDSLFMLSCDYKMLSDPPQGLCLKISSKKLGLVNKYDIVFSENNSYFNPTLLGVLYALASTSYIYIFLSPFIYLFLSLYKQAEITLKKYFRYTLLVSSILLSAIGFYFYHLGRQVVLLNFEYFYLPLLVSILPLTVASFLLFRNKKNKDHATG
jgi:hypothetical protein